MSMLPRLARPALSAGARSGAAQASALAGFHSSATQLATLRELEQRVKSVKNIEKITKSMMMIASTKLHKAQRAMRSAQAYGESNNEIFKNSEAVAPEGGNQLFIVVSSDKGLCGGIHSSVSRKTRSELGKIGGEAAASSDSAEGPKVVVLGEKSKAQLARALPKNLALSFNQIGKDVPTFADASAIADQIVRSGVKFDKVNIVYNAYVSAIAFESRIMENAGDMITNLQMQYNRGRQATITNELVDIITGASAL
ncbi:atp synthase f1 gamma [Ceraceosorus bombacis]|uniref:ATP synthase subunit gamma, mitochondrial n=1 Tax=Ceraceosorus bombacis TaxID=401625 RepID=A0A0P1BN91_9BASI|nr:atp synthase f1 gamma [Ceraceosorus bombacis]